MRGAVAESFAICSSYLNTSSSGIVRRRVSQMQAPGAKKRSKIRIVSAKVFYKIGNFSRTVFVGTHLANASEVRVSCCVKSARKNLAVLTIQLHEGESKCIQQAAN